MILRATALLFGLFAASVVMAQQAVTEAPGVQLRGVDRINGETFDVILPAGQTARLERIAVTLRSCRYPVGNPAGDAYASL